uniref:Testis expressed 264, ER-phagy receptor a n=1 Tax=Hippocampus comes TaxID=109280 RepID=A0A3Q2Y804_HIPCM
CSSMLLLSIVLFVTISILAGYFLYSGLLSDIIILTGSPPIRKLMFVYKFKEGPYKKCAELFKEANSIGPELSCIGIFYDDPTKVPGPQCRCAVGSIVSEGEDKADKELLKRYETAGFKVFSFPEVTHVVTTSFPHRTVFSIPLGVKRVYPRLESYIKVFCFFSQLSVLVHPIHLSPP